MQVPKFFQILRRSGGTQKTSRILLLDVFLQIHGADFGPIHGALVIHRNTFCPAGRTLWRRIWNEGLYLAVFGAADPDAPLTARVMSITQLVCGLRVSHIHGVALVDENSARPAKLLPLGDELAVLVENLDAVVGTVADK